MITIIAIENRNEGEKLREGIADEGVRVEPPVPVVDAGVSEPGIVDDGVMSGVVSDTGARAGVSAAGIVPEGPGEADGPKAVGPGAGSGAPAEALH